MYQTTYNCQLVTYCCFLFFQHKRVATRKGKEKRIHIQSLKNIYAHHNPDCSHSLLGNPIGIWRIKCHLPTSNLRSQKNLKKMSEIVDPAFQLSNQI